MRLPRILGAATTTVAVSQQTILQQYNIPDRCASACRTFEEFVSDCEAGPSVACRQFCQSYDRPYVNGCLECVQYTRKFQTSGVNLTEVVAEAIEDVCQRTKEAWSKATANATEVEVCLSVNQTCGETTRQE